RCSKSSRWISAPRPAPRPWPSRARSRCISRGSSPATLTQTSAAASAARTTPRSCTRSRRSRPCSRRIRSSRRRSSTSSRPFASIDRVHRRPRSVPVESPAVHRLIPDSRPGRRSVRAACAPRRGVVHRPYASSSDDLVSWRILRLMDVQVSREPLLRAMQLVQNIVEPRQTLPILANVLLDARADGLQIAATDLEVGARVAVPATVGQPGAVTLGARSLLELVRELPAQPSIHLTREESGWVRVECGSGRFRLVGLPADEFPPLEMNGGNGWVAVDGAKLRAMLTRTAYAMS